MVKNKNKSNGTSRTHTIGGNYAAKSEDPSKDKEVKDVKQKALKSVKTKTLKASPFQLHLIVIFTFCTSLLIYLLTLYPSMPGGDSGELMATAKEFGVAHPPGYPLFIILAKLTIEAFPVGTVAFRVNFLSALFGSLANALVAATILRSTGDVSVSLIITAMMAFSRLFWIWSITGEVFSLNNALCAALIYGSLIYIEETCPNRKLRIAHWLAFISGVCMSNQHTSILFIIPCALYVANSTFDEELLTHRSFITILLSAAAGLLPYLQLPLVSYMRMAKVTWGDHRTLEGFLFHFFRKDFGTFKLVTTDNHGSMLNNAKVMLTDEIRELTLPVIVLAVIGALSILWRKERRGYVLYLLALHISYVSFFCSLANIEAIVGIYKGVLERFWMQPSIVICLLAAEGLTELIKAARINKFYMFASSVVLVAARIHSNYSTCDMSDNWHVENFGKHVLNHLPANTIMLTSGDLSTNTFRYLTIAEHIRPDVLVLDMSFIGSSWYIPMIAEHMDKIIFPGIGYKPGPSSDRRFYNVEEFLNYNLHRRPVFSCLKPRKEAHGFEHRYRLLPFSYCCQFMRKGAVNHLMYGRNVPSPQFSEYFPPKPESYAEHTWEHVLIHEYWEAKVKAGRYLWDQGERTKDPEARKLLYIAAYDYLSKQKDEILKLIDAGKLSPISWNHTSYYSKYLGVQCRQLWVLHGRDPKYDACQRRHFKDYVDSVPALSRANDKDFPGVLKLLENPGT